MPSLEALFPVAVQAGTTQMVTAVGKFEPWPVQIWMDAPGIRFSPETNNGRFKVVLAPDAPAGPHWMRAFHEHGASSPRLFVVTQEPQLLEAEPNDSYLQPQPIEKLPASINGRLEKQGDVDSFGVHLESGQTLVARIEAYVLGSPLDAVLRVVDARGVQLGLNHDDGRTLDPFLAFTAPAAGAYVLQVFGFAYPADAEVRFTGNAKCSYRLHLAGTAYARYTIPLGVARHGFTHLRLAGWNLGTNDSMVFDGQSLPPQAIEAPLTNPCLGHVLSVPISDGAELIEHEPNDTAETAESCSLPFAVTGRIDAPGDTDRFRVELKKGDALQMEVGSAAFGFPVDAWLETEDAQGKQLQRADDNVGYDPALVWTAPKDGTFIIAVGNVLHRGGADCYYRLNVRRAVPGVRVTMSANALVVEPGKTNEVKISVKLLNTARVKLTAVADGLPEGARLFPLEIPEKGGDVTLKLAVALDARPFNGPIQLRMRDGDSGALYTAVNELTTAGVDNGVPNGFNHLLIESIDQFWLTVPPLKAAKVADTK